MAPFEFVFSLFGLLLGLSLAEVIGGFGKALKRQPVKSVGWLVPLLGLIVALDLITFWSLAWTIRDDVPVLFVTLVAGFLITGLYYLAATLVFPEVISADETLDSHYFKVRRRVVGAVVICNFSAYATIIPLLGRFPFGFDTAISLALWFVVALAVLAVRTTRTSVALLATMLLFYVYDAVGVFFA